MKLAIVGSRDYPHMERVKQFVEGLPFGYTLISGGARGVDRVAEEAAEKRGMPTIIFKAQWTTKNGKRDKGAGFKRNHEIVRECDQLVAFWDGTSNGTRHSIELAIKRRKPFAVFGPEGYVIAEGGHEYDVDGGESALLNAVERVNTYGEALGLPTVEDGVERAKELGLIPEIVLPPGVSTQTTALLPNE